ncbi:hypothetical protein AB4K20DRAFT_1977625 [Rhizopus microsporus]
MRSGFEWARKIELKNREAAGNSSYTTRFPQIFDFMKGYRHRETKAYLIQNRQITDNHVCDLNKFKKVNGIVTKEAKRTVITYGDASLTGTKAGYTPIRVKKVQRALAQRTLVIPVGEFRTSNVRLKGERNATLRCLDDNKRIVCRTSECYLLIIYQLKSCQLCPTTNDCDIVSMARGINVALNIRSILVSYVGQPSLKRESTFGGDQATSRPL